MSVGRGKSLLIGPAVRPDGTRTTVYRALTALVCAQCGTEIAVGHVFSRRSRHAPGGFMGGGAVMEAVCLACRPVGAEGAGAG